MKELYISKPENKGGVILLGFAIFVIIVLIIVICTDRPMLSDIEKPTEWLVLTMLLLAVAAWVIYILDEAIWQICGAEICEYDDERIYVTKKKMVKRRWRISWSDISEVAEYSPSTVWKAVTSMTMAGTPQEKIVIRYGKGRRLKCGTNLNEIQTREAIESIRNGGPKQ